MSFYNKAKKYGARVVAGGSSLVAAGLASAAIDVADVQTALTSAQSSGEDVGAMVIGVVAALCVVGVIIGLVRKV
jgi:hypothetical protein